jgi:hypothetical protein
MIGYLRESFNANFKTEKYHDFLNELERDNCEISFRLAETPVFIPSDLKKKLIEAGEEIIGLIRRPDFKKMTDGAIPLNWAVPGENDHPHFLTFDFGICKDEHGQLVPMLIEMQGFPSLYGFQVHLSNTCKSVYGLPDNLTPFFEGMNESSYLKLLKEVIVGPYKPEQVALMDIGVLQQKTLVDFLVTQKYLGIKILGLADILKEGKSLYYMEEGRKIYLKRIYNRLIFDEVSDKTDIFKKSFDPRDELDIEWITHPNWFYRVSKYTMPFLQSKFVPKTRFLNNVTELPKDLENYVLKPLFSFAGMGVIIDVKKEDIYNIQDPENWILQQKVNYEPVVSSPDGDVKVELRMMYLWPDGGAPKLCINLARLSRGKMIGVRYNEDFDWVGGTVGLMES